MPRVTIFLLFVFGALTACIDFPDLDDAVSEQARNNPYPKLIQLDGSVAFANQGAAQTEAAAESMKARVKRLRARAAKLRRPVVDRRTRRRMAAALRRHPA